MIISFTGCDGAGKTTHIDLLKKRICNSCKLSGINLLDITNGVLVYENIRDIDLIYKQLEKYDVMIKMVKKMKEDNELDYRMFHALYEHKSIMVKRVEELMNQGLISSDEVLVSEAEEIEKISDICRMMVLKYNILPRDDMLEELERNLLELKDKEIIFLTKLRDKL